MQSVNQETQIASYSVALFYSVSSFSFILYIHLLFGKV